MTTARCSRCSRPLKNPVLLSGVAFGSKCAQAMAGAKAKRQRRARAAQQQREVDPRQRDLFHVEEVMP